MGRHRRRDARPLADPRQDASSRPKRQLRLGHRRLQGDARLAHVFAHTITRDEPHPINAPFTLERFRAAAESRDATAMPLENSRFHEIIGEMSGNVYLRASLSRLLIDHARIGHTFFRPRNDEMSIRLDSACRHHDAFIEAIRSHDEHAVVDLSSSTGNCRARTWRCSSRRGG